MKVISVQFSLKPEHVEEFIEQSLGDAKGSVENEPGCLRFDVYRDEEDPNIVCFYEVYRDDAALEAHRQMPHYAKWQGRLKEQWYAAKAQVIRGRSVYPPDEDWKK